MHGPAYLRCACQRQGTGKLLAAGMRPLTVGEWLQEWLAAKKKLRAATVRSYESHMRLYLVPRIGHIPLDRLRVADVACVFDYIDGVLPADPGDPAVGDRRLHEAASRRAARQRRRARRTAAWAPA